MILPENFYESEIRCGYEVTEKTKKVWAVELDLLEKFVEVCERNNLNYFLDGGTLLGAVRHKGFIPWDDDIDVIMPREDYNKLREIADEEFKEPYFFQTTFNQEEFFRAHAQLRNSNTTGFIELDGRKEHVNKGIFIDIFILDNIPGCWLSRKILKHEIIIKRNFLEYKYDRRYERQTKWGKIFYKIVQVFFKFYPFKKFFKNFDEKTLAKYSKRKTALVGDLTLKWNPRVHWKREWYDGYTYLEFEGMKLRAPLFYREILQKQYGFGYMKYIKGKNNHGGVTFDPDTPYKEYCEKMKENNK